MKKKILTWLIVAALAFGALYLFYLKPRIKARRLEYTFTRLMEGDIEASISSTGTLEAINTIQVGTQISGTISKIYVDYNDQVKAGQLLAEIDTRLLRASLSNAHANVAVLRTKLGQAEEEFKRNVILFEKKVITEKEYKDSKYAYEQMLGNRNAAEASLKSAEVNLGYAYIRSPIAGTVTERSVEEGQTVAASFATPTLFIIAENLSNMQILADVDESDIGYISEGMAVRFTVQTYPDKSFFGKVSQVRLQPVRINNVVNYKVVVQVSNREGLLLPGMTASLDFISEGASGVLLVNNSALRFRPNEVMLRQIKPMLISKAASLPDSLETSFLKTIENEESFLNGGFRRVLPGKIGGIFYEADNKLAFEFVELGITTGLQSEVKSFLTGTSLPPGTPLINGIQSPEK